MNLLTKDQLKLRNDKQPRLSKYKYQNNKWSFSFQYWKQIKYFGLVGKDGKWFASLLKRLKYLSGMNIDKFLSNGSDRNSWRYHDINWNQKNIPIQRKDLEWIDNEYLDNDDEYPLVQFQVSQSLGRIVGFFDEKMVFNIVLIDPFHNLQPSKSHSYKVNDTSILSCEFSSLLKRISNIVDKIDNKDITKILNEEITCNVVMHFISDDDLLKCENLIKKGEISSILDVFYYGLEFFSSNE